MKVGVPKEIKTLEFRVGMTPAGVRELVHDGHEVVVETNAGIGIGMTDADYEAAGAEGVDRAEHGAGTAAGGVPRARRGHRVGVEVAAADGQILVDHDALLRPADRDDV